ncbi:lytic transglycosylase domain-containing protein [Roseateles sp. DC23W]|uniref:Lytic transglycosylase domain-containing protein n=1 Tax=Pelomonas dachongensis TaxID=3299029 RepID=A0ABW7EVQ0_9BURK
MDSTVFISLVHTCAPQVHATTARALVAIESSFNPWAIGVVGGRLERQPRSRQEAVATARALQANGWNFSAGLGQINVRNFAWLGLSLDAAFDPCSNLTAMQAVLGACFDRASAGQRGPPQAALQRALSCYYSGNFTTGFQHGYVQKVVSAASPARPSAHPSTASKE